ncbi:MAG: GMC oxidoreductase, partial [Pseudomonadota bacterium]|nr:GMC oxidoreductase [Pseudomonadota bacterium]
RGSRDLEIRANREIIVSAGAVNSPHILQVSGIGPAAHLKSIGVDVLHNAPGVGHNMTDHYVVRISHRIKDMITINQLARGPRLVGELFKYAIQGTGALTMGVTAAMVFSRSREGLSSPDLQLLYTPTSYTGRVIGDLETEPGISVAVCPVRPESRGTIMAESANPLERPVIRPNYMSAESDSHVLLAGIQQTNRILEAPALAEVSLGETVPGRDINSPEDAKQFAQEAGATIYHPVGTCRMGEDTTAVVDSRLRVNGVDGLRVIDASVMPTVTTGNTNAPTIMIGEKGAAMIKEDAAAA